MDVYTQMECLRDTLKDCISFEINVPLILGVIKAVGKSIELSGINAEKIRGYIVECKLLEIILNILNKLEVIIIFNFYGFILLLNINFKFLH